MPVLITGSTKAKLDSRFFTRRLCRTRVVGIETPVELYELHCDDASQQWLNLRHFYERGLERYEQGEWSQCCAELVPLVSGTEEHDSPSLMLMQRAIQCLTQKPEKFDSVIYLDSK